MAFIDCIADKAKKGVLKQGDVDALNRKYENLVKQYSKSMNDTQAAAKAAEDVVNAQRAEIAQKRRNEIQHAIFQENIVKDIEAKVADGTFKSFDQGVRNLFENAHARRQTILKQYLSNLDQFVEQFRSKSLGLVQDKEGMIPVVKELLGDATGNESARLFAKSLRNTFDIAHKRFKTAGGVIGKIDNYFPQIHARERVQQVDFEEWYSFIRPKLDTDKMIDMNTGLPISEERLLKLAGDDYQDIVTNGRFSLQQRAKEGKQTPGFGTDISQRRMSSRFYQFKDADSFLAYNDRFGTGDEGLYDMVIGHLDNFARDTGTLELMGPRPNAMQRHLDLQMSAKGVGDTQQKFTNGMYDVLVGRTDGWAGESALFTILGNAQNVMRSAMLGSASISALSDATFVTATANLNGLSGTRAIGRYMGQLNPASSADRNLAKSRGYISEVASNSALMDARISGENFGGKFTSFLASFTNRASGLAAMTKGAADAISLELEATLSEFAKAKTAWKDLDPKFRDSAASHGINESDWNIVLKTKPLVEPNSGTAFIGSNEIVKGKGDVKQLNDVANKIDDWSTTLRNIATNEPTLRTRALATGAFTGADVRKGTAARAFFGSAFMFKSFPVTVMFNHVLPAFKDAAKGNMQHLATVAVGTTVLGGLALQLKEIVKGKDPKDMSDSKFWSAAMMQGGGLGLFGDFLFSDYSRFGRDPLSEFLLGPVGGVANDVLRTFKGNFDRAIEDPEKFQDRFLRDVFNLAKRNTPAVNLWYSRLVVERLFLDQIERQLDPKFDRRQRMIENRMNKETGQNYWWRKGETAPRRAPEQAEVRR